MVFLEIVKLLLQDQRTDVNKQDKYGSTPFHVACANGKIEVVKYMMQDQRIDVNKPDNYGWIPIWIASNRGHSLVVQAILQSGRNINLDAKYENKTALEQARQNGYQDIVNLIENYTKNIYEGEKIIIIK